ncbi:MAG: HAD family hydrolase [Brevinema sp.]
MKFKAILFDMDGVVVDSEHVGLKYIHKRLEDAGFLVEPSLLNSLVGLNTKDYLNQLSKVLDNKISTKMCAEIVDPKNFCNSIINGTVEIPLIEGFTDISQKFCGKLKYAIASGSPKAVILAHAKRYNFDKCFSAYVSSEEVSAGKPEPDVFLEAAKQLDVPIQECIVIEDSPFGVIAGKAAGAHTIAVPTVFTQSFSFDSADKICSSLHEVSLYIESLIS